jgi:uncharacterized protein YbbK (DUF523 family)
MHLEGDPAAPKLVTVSTGIDLTEKMMSYSSKKTEELKSEQLSGFIFKARSPSCGVYDTTINVDTVNIATGKGIFTKAVTMAFPDLVVEDEETIKDQDTLKIFLERAGGAG